jgi:osmoprotectant transport system ATP-binding protein
MFELVRISKRYHDEPVLGPLDLSLASEQRLALIGPSGSGKSTVLRLLVGLVTPDSGQVTVLGEPVNARSAERLRLRLGYVIQEGALFPHLTAAANVTIVAEQLGWSAERRQARSAELRELVRLPETVLRRYPAELSGGERQRVALMRALFLDPELLLLDEPLGAVDPWNRLALEADLLNILVKLKKTVLLVTHDLSQAAYLTAEIAVMHGGVLQQRGTFDELRRNPATTFVREFVAERASSS